MTPVIVIWDGQVPHRSGCPTNAQAEYRYQQPSAPCGAGRGQSVRAARRRALPFPSSSHCERYRRG